MVDRVLDERFEDLGLLGRGGMGEVRCMRERSSGRLVALKLVPADLPREPLERFRRECTVLGKLSHPGVVPVLGSGELPDGRFFYTMPYVENSRSLVDWIRAHFRSSTASPSHGAIQRLLSDLGAALEHVHAMGVVHRDIKPSNIIVKPDGSHVLIDFGLAGLVNSSLTRSGVVLGTMQYMAPELARGHDATPATDVYGLGMVLYEVLTGRRAVLEPAAYLKAIALGTQSIVPPSHCLPGLSPSLDRLVMSALELEPEARPSPAGQLLRALSECTGGDVARLGQHLGSHPGRLARDHGRLTTPSAVPKAFPAAPPPVPVRDPRTLRAPSSLLLAAVLAIGAALGFRAWGPGSVRLARPVEVVLGFNSARLRVHATRPCLARVVTGAGARNQAVIESPKAQDHQILVGPFEAAVPVLWTLDLNGAETSTGQLLVPGPPRLQALEARINSGGCDLDIQLSVPATVEAHCDAAVSSGRTRSTTVAVRHSLRLSGVTEPTSCALVLKSAIEEEVTLPAVSLTPH